MLFTKDGAPICGDSPRFLLLRPVPFKLKPPLAAALRATGDVLTSALLGEPDTSSRPLGTAVINLA